MNNTIINLSPLEILTDFITSNNTKTTQIKDNSADILNRIGAKPIFNKKRQIESI